MIDISSWLIWSWSYTEVVETYTEFAHQNEILEYGRFVTHITSWLMFRHMGWLRLVGSLKLQVSFAEYSLFYMALLQKRPIVLRSLLIVATPYPLTPPRNFREQQAQILTQVSTAAIWYNQLRSELTFENFWICTFIHFYIYVYSIFIYIGKVSDARMCTSAGMRAVSTWRRTNRTNWTTYTCTYIYVYVYIHIYTCIYMYIHIYVYTCAHIYIISRYHMNDSYIYV